MSTNFALTITTAKQSDKFQVKQMFEDHAQFTVIDDSTPLQFYAHLNGQEGFELTEHEKSISVLSPTHINVVKRVAQELIAQTETPKVSVQICAI